MDGLSRASLVHHRLPSRRHTPPRERPSMDHKLRCIPARGHQCTMDRALPCTDWMALARLCIPMVHGHQFGILVPHHDKIMMTIWIQVQVLARSLRHKHPAMPIQIHLRLRIRQPLLACIPPTTPTPRMVPQHRLRLVITVLDRWVST